MCVCLYTWAHACVQSHVTEGNVGMFPLAEKKLWPLCAVVDNPKRDSLRWLLTPEEDFSLRGVASVLPFRHVLVPSGPMTSWPTRSRRAAPRAGGWGRRGRTSWILALVALCFVFHV